MSTSETMPTIRVSAVVLRDDRGAVLTVRKRGSTRFMLPGGKPDRGENAAQTAVREVCEELSVHLEPSALRPLGVFRAAAANEPGFEVESTVFEHPSVTVSQPAAEIEELRWQSLDEPYPTDLAPLLAEHVLPILSGNRPRP
ncbi:NUDIX domain-containing protein [Mycobacteroides abscessus]|uniref:MutT/NUDIX family protein n=4 Tax=Mycobacteroides abscessus TaxID=36809 RepID=B1MET9_MYCA9|nr:MutT/NUDIX family protein [Mycobacteroides abscessus M94]EIV59521.1 mutT/NUDIX family protein [Mycobacteroides abscessus 4S-0116-S]EPZ22478.1 NUDIX hydrolase [Mycobacteroides abscessus V06705]MBN7292183.1 NUDIX domain-containing protein [Mycobacteroides abscessus subsp. abscessus]MCA4713438.1 NUDIX domain-containing protein [Mycobacteroides abscessus]CAM63545.1 MutT/NUDIX family protein [Mycobacteroides abscessus ATCC 19977]